MFTVTRDWVHAHCSSSRSPSWTRAQLAILGVSWPPQKGWLSQLHQQRWQITQAQRKEFERLGPYAASKVVTVKRARPRPGRTDPKLF
jgi:hypothetical protein